MRICQNVTMLLLTYYLHFDALWVQFLKNFKIWLDCLDSLKMLYTKFSVNGSKNEGGEV